MRNVYVFEEENKKERWRGREWPFVNSGVCINEQILQITEKCFSNRSCLSKNMEHFQIGHRMRLNAILGEASRVCKQR